MVEKEILLVGCILFRAKEDDYEFLLLKRIPEKGGFWQYVTGKIEPNELDDYSIAAYREACEEASLDRKDAIRLIENVHKFEFDKNYLTDGPSEIHKEFVYAIEVSNNFIPNIDNNIYPEHTESCWASFDEALNLMKWNTNKDAIRKLYNMIKKTK